MTTESATTYAPADENLWLELDAHLPRWHPPPASAHAVVVVPHPDDETLACGGLLQRLQQRGWSTDLILVTDGEASEGVAEQGARLSLIQQRRHELASALATMGLTASVHPLAIPDSAVGEHEQELRQAIERLTQDADLIIAPHRFDWHSDHEAAGRAAFDVASASNVPILAYGVWLWNAVSPTDPRFEWAAAVAVDLTAAEADAKRRAIAGYRSQVEGDEPVVPESVVAHHCRSTEIYFPIHTAGGR